MLICTTQGYYRRMLDLCHTVHEHWDIFFLRVCCFTVWENTCTYEAASLFCDRPLIPLAYIVCFVWERPSKISAHGFSLTSRDWNWGLIEAVHVFPTVPPLPLQWWEGCVFGFVLTHFLLQIQRCLMCLLGRHIECAFNKTVSPTFTWKHEKVIVEEASTSIFQCCKIKLGWLLPLNYPTRLP